ncbi:MAG: hypothetical protein H0V12_09835 [Chloroflexi bacterium]|nr:hypothetical protein [Chloroflexota bacterium]
MAVGDGVRGGVSEAVAVGLAIAVAVAVPVEGAVPVGVFMAVALGDDEMELDGGDADGGGDAGADRHAPIR